MRAILRCAWPTSTKLTTLVSAHHEHVPLPQHEQQGDYCGSMMDPVLRARSGFFCWVGIAGGLVELLQGHWARIVAGLAEVVKGALWVVRQRAEVLLASI